MVQLICSQITAYQVYSKVRMDIFTIRRVLPDQSTTSVLDVESLFFLSLSVRSKIPSCSLKVGFRWVIGEGKQGGSKICTRTVKI